MSTNEQNLEQRIEKITTEIDRIRHLPAEYHELRENLYQITKIFEIIASRISDLDDRLFYIESLTSNIDIPQRFI